MTGTDGYVVIDKPAGCTSHDVVARCRRVLGTRKVGHAGTLDPDATGVLLVGVGRATRLLRYASTLGKSYTCEIVLGVATTTLDASGEVTERVEMPEIALEEARTAALGLTGRIEQLPPMVSAVKVGGRRLYELAREGVEVERARRSVEVFSFALSAGSEPGTLHAEVDCSSGTYVRVLAADLGERLGGRAHLRALRRTSVGSHGLGEAVALEELTGRDLRPPAGLVSDLSSGVLDEEAAEAVSHGRSIERQVAGVVGAGPFALFSSSGALLAVAEARGETRLQPVVVLSAAD